jgi:CheY-like chemotaxis protein
MIFNGPHILIIDDEPDIQRFRIADLEKYGAYVQILHPEDITEEDLLINNLIIVDLRLENWPERENLHSLALRPMDGLALCSVLRSQIMEHKKDVPVGFAILSGHLNDLSFGLPSESRAHVIAHSLNLEWAFSKSSQNGSNLNQRLFALAEAIRQLPTKWSRSNYREMNNIVCELLQLDPDLPWSERAWYEIESSHPPINELYLASHGLAFIRWLLHRILSYPCFLLDTRYLAVRLRLDFHSFEDTILKNQKFFDLFSPYLYSGILKGFSGHRWWRSGIEDFLWNLTDGNPFNIDLMRERIEKAGGAKIANSNVHHPVICIDENYQPIPKYSRIEDAVRIQPDDWPAYAEQAWTTKDLARNIPSLKLLVINQDRLNFNEDNES